MEKAIYYINKPRVFLSGLPVGAYPSR